MPLVDQDYRYARAPGHSVSLDRGAIAIVVPSFALPSRFTVAAADLLLRLSSGHPDVAPDMWWFELSQSSAARSLNFAN
ncbi:E2/UBC family protein [Mesorhizobium australicum]|uniref:E2/UBC family protein n=1 Tax=Mesorhizobium australicum TaxID=536018 RepID=UPI00333512F6